MSVAFIVYSWSAMNSYSDWQSASENPKTSALQKHTTCKTNAYKYLKTIMEPCCRQSSNFQIKVMFARKDTKATDVRYSEKFRFHPIAYSEVIVH